MKIGIDIDGVLTNKEKFDLDYGTKFSIDNGIFSKKNMSKYNIGEAYSWSCELNKNFWKKYYEWYCINIPVRRFASNVIKKLKEEGHEIYIITARGSEVKNYSKTSAKALTLDWLSKNEIYFDKIIFTKGEKSKYCIKNKIDIMIEDKEANILDISRFIPVICFNAGYNSNIEIKNVFRVYDFNEIYDYISKI
ncbi:MAG: hypothetical protein RSB67_01685 [Clostridia bacterium]